MASAGRRAACSERRENARIVAPVILLVATLQPPKPAIQISLWVGEDLQKSRAPRVQFLVLRVLITG